MRDVCSRKPVRRTQHAIAGDILGCGQVCKGVETYPLSCFHVEPLETIPLWNYNVAKTGVLFPIMWFYFCCIVACAAFHPVRLYENLLSQLKYEISKTNFIRKPVAKCLYRSKEFISFKKLFARHEPPCYEPINCKCLEQLRDEVCIPASLARGRVYSCPKLWRAMNSTLLTWVKYLSAVS